MSNPEKLLSEFKALYSSMHESMNRMNEIAQLLGFGAAEELASVNTTKQSNEKSDKIKYKNEGLEDWQKRVLQDFCEYYYDETLTANEDLTAWEVDFMESQLEKDITWKLSPKQEDVFNRIGDKLGSDTVPF